VVDSTAAGDAFTGALGVAIAEGQSVGDAMVFANAAGALWCTKPGAQPALPSRSEVDRLVAAAESRRR
jgi:ribokinase